MNELLAPAADRGDGSPRPTSVFGTPTVAHRSMALVVAAMLTAPWHGLTRRC